MNDDLKRALLIYPTGVFACFSFLGSYYVIISSIYFKNKLIRDQRKAYKKIGKKVNLSNDIRLTNDYTVTDIIMWMCMTHLILDIFLILNYIPQMISKTFKFSDNTCKLIGLFGQFSGIASPLWHLIIAWSLYYLLTRNDYNNYNKFVLIKQKTKLISGLIVLTILGTIIPIIDDAYGELTNNQDFSEWECWINKNDYQLIVFIPMIISVLFHYIVLIIACFKYAKTKSFTNAYVILMKRLIVWIIVFSILRIIPTFVRFLVIFNLDDDIPFILIVLHHYCIGLWGFGNGIVWFINKNCTNTTKYKEYYSQSLIHCKYKRETIKYGSNNNNNEQKSIQNNDTSIST